MNREYLERMSAKELDEYAETLGIISKVAKSKADKISLIERRREKVATIRALGVDFEVPIKRAHDMRVSELLGKDGRTDAETEEAMRLLLGDEQLAELAKACTEEDGTVDVLAMGLAYVRILTSEELKNF